MLFMRTSLESYFCFVCHCFVFEPAWEGAKYASSLDRKFLQILRSSLLNLGRLPGFVLRKYSFTPQDWAYLKFIQVFEIGMKKDFFF